MTIELSNPTDVKPKKKSFFKRWWFWVLAALVLLMVIGILSSGGNSNIELSTLMSMNRQQIVEKFGKPDNILTDSKYEFEYAYDGFHVRGNDKNVVEVILSNGFLKKKKVDSYTLARLTLDSSYDEAIKNLGTPDKVNQSKNMKGAEYLTKDDYILKIMTKDMNTDKIDEIQLTEYKSSLEAKNDMSETLGADATEDKLKSIFEITDKKSNSIDNIYTVLGKMELYVDKGTNQISSIHLTGRSVYDIFGLRVGDSSDDAEKVLGKSTDNIQLSQTDTQFVYKYKDKEIRVTVDNNK